MASYILNECMNCGGTATSKCSRCHVIRYCSKECQRKDWPKHKEKCSNNLITFSHIMEKYVMSNRNLTDTLSIFACAPHNVTNVEAIYEVRFTENEFTLELKKKNTRVKERQKILVVGFYSPVANQCITCNSEGLNISEENMNKIRKKYKKEEDHDERIVYSVTMRWE